MGKYFVVKGLPQAILIEQNFFTGKITLTYQGEILEEVVKGEFDLTFPDGSTKVLAFHKSFMNLDYPRVFLERDEIKYLIPLNNIQRGITILPAVMILTNGLIGVLFATIGVILFTKIYRSVSNQIIATVYNISFLGILWVIATMLSVYVYTLF